MYCDFMKEEIENLCVFYFGYVFCFNIEVLVLIDKMIINFFFVGLFLVVIFEVKFIYIYCDLRVVCWFNYCVVFCFVNMLFVYDYFDMVEFYGGYVKLMNFWE